MFSTLIPVYGDITIPGSWGAHLGYTLTDEKGGQLTWEMGPDMYSLDDIGRGLAHLYVYSPDTPLPKHTELTADVSVRPSPDNPWGDECIAAECIRKTLRAIESEHIIYDSLGTNSNSAATTAFQHCGLALTHGGGRKLLLSRYYPGIGIDLLPQLPANVGGGERFLHTGNSF